MIDMRIGEYHITSDPRNYIVSLANLSYDGTPKTVMTKSGEILSERVLGFYNSLSQAFKAIAKDMMIRGGDRVTGVEQYAREASKIDKELKDAIAEYSKNLASIGEKGKESGKIASSKWEGLNK